MPEKPPLSIVLTLAMGLFFMAPAVRLGATATPLPATPLPATQAPDPDPRVRPGHWNKRKIPDGWVVLETDHYHVQSQCGTVKAKRLAAHLEQVTELYQEFLPFRKKVKTFVLKLFKDRQSFMRYAAAPGALAYYDQTHKELVAYDTGKIAGVLDVGTPYSVNQRFDAELDEAELTGLADLLERVGDTYIMDVAGVLAHEGWHQYFHHYTVSWVAMPAWIDEGVGDYFYMASYDEQLGGFQLGAMNHVRLRRLRYAFDDGSTVPFGELIQFEQRDYYSNAPVFYSQGWSVVQFLMHHPDRNVRAVVPKYIKLFKDNKSIKKTNKLVFGKFDLDELDAEWIGWVLTQTVNDPLYELAVQFGDRLAPNALDGFDGMSTAAIRSVYTDRMKRARDAGDQPNPLGLAGNDDEPGHDERPRRQQRR